MGEVSASKGPALEMSFIRSSAVDHGILSGDTPEANTVDTADCPGKMLASVGIVYTSNVIGASDPDNIVH